MVRDDGLARQAAGTTAHSAVSSSTRASDVGTNGAKKKGQKRVSALAAPAMAGAGVCAPRPRHDRGHPGQGGSPRGSTPRRARGRCESHLCRRTRDLGQDTRTAILSSRCAAAGPLGLEWPPVVPCRALMRKSPRFPNSFFLTNALRLGLRSLGRRLQAGAERYGRAARRDRGRRDRGRYLRVRPRGGSRRASAVCSFGIDSTCLTWLNKTGLGSQSLTWFCGESGHVQ